MGDVLSYQDFITFGMGLDIAGAVLIAWGLIRSPADISKLSATFYGGNPFGVKGLVSDRASGEIGLVALLAGFVFQLSGYVLGSLSPSPTPSPARSGVMLASAVVAVGIVSIANAVYAPWRRARLEKAAQKTKP